MDAIRSLILSPLLGGPPYLAFATLLMLVGIGFPFSSDLILITGGVFSGTGIFELAKAIPIAWAGILTGDSLAFFAGRRFGRRITAHRYFRRLCPPAKFEEISGFLRANDTKFVFMVRFTPGMRSVIFLTAGTVGVRPRTFYAMNMLSTAIWVPILMSLAKAAAANVDALIAQFQAFNQAIAVALVALVATLYYRRRRKRIGAGSREP
jgi:membrane protein DedA with SNARE-associated domain